MNRLTVQSTLCIKAHRKTFILLSSSLFLSGCISVPFGGADKSSERIELSNNQTNRSIQHTKSNEGTRGLKNIPIAQQIDGIKKRNQLTPSHPEYISYSENKANHLPVDSKKLTTILSKALPPTKEGISSRYSKSNYDQLAIQYSKPSIHKPMAKLEGFNQKISTPSQSVKLIPIEQTVVRAKALIPTISSTIKPSSKVSKLAHYQVTADTTSEKSHKDDLEQNFQPLIWDKMYNQFYLAEEYLGEYDSNIRYFKKRPAFLKRVSKRAQPYLYHIFSEVKRRNMPYEIALLPIIESSFQPIARSHQAAGGLWQFIPSTAHLYGLDQNWWFDARQDALLSTDAALDYLQKLYKLNNNDWLLALASYNGGIGNVKKAIRKYRKKHKNPKSNPGFWDIRPYLLKETRHYVPQLLGVSHVINRAKEFNIPLAPITDSPYFAQVKLKQQATLAKVATIAGLSVKELSGLNSGYLRPTTPPKGPYNLILPIKNAKRLESAISHNSSLFDIQWIKHVIQPGESLSVIAHNYTATTRAIKEVNGMHNNRIRAGKTLLIPIPKEYANKLKSFTNKKRYIGPKKIHRVKAGDSIWSIARYYNVDTRTLCMWNRIGIKSPLRKGQHLEIRSNKYGYTIKVAIKKGESLWTLAKRYNVSTTELFRWNSIKKSKAIAPGTLLTIWQPNTKANGQLARNGSHRQYKVQKGDNLWNIAKANQVTAKLLARYNNLPLERALHPGQMLKIPFKS